MFNNKIYKVMDKQEFKLRAKSSIDEINAKFNELESKKNLAQATVKNEITQKLNELQSKKNELITKYEMLENATEETWNEAKTSFSAVTESVKEGLTKINNII
jgi:outer membrane murein-binding lipoprotein Lpp